MTRNLFSVRGTAAPSLAAALVFSMTALPSVVDAQEAPATGVDAFVTGTRQLTFSGKRAGEGYFSADGKRLIFQSERDAANPFYQIYLLDFETGDTRRLSDGTGKTTCAWLHPDGKKFLFASTHEDPASPDLQAAELKDRAEGKQKRYSWDYDEHFDIHARNLDGTDAVNLTKTRGYDAEGSYSPDGQWVAFASNRHAYTETLTPEEQAKFDGQKSWLMDIYLMRADGSEVKRLTNVRGYDGGPFFSADGRKICWRRFTEEEDRAEVWTMNMDGSDQKPLTKLGAMSWAPYFHPSGEYVIFTTNKHGFDNFELYMAAATGQGEPVRVTNTAGFDGLPVFSPDGKQLAWTSNRTAEKASQIFIADWDHAAARKSLGLTAPAADAATAPAAPAAAAIPPPAAADLTPGIAEDDFKKHIAYLASDTLQGRLTGTAGEQLATDYAAGMFKSFGLLPAGDGETFFHGFDFTAGVALGPGNSLTVSGVEGFPPAAVEKDWIPLTFSSTGTVDPAPVVFAGYGMEIPEGVDAAGKRTEAYSSYFHLDVKDKWVMLFRYLPEGISQEERVRFGRFASLRFKALTARQKGARGIIVVSGPSSKVQQQLVPLSFDASMAGSGLAALSLTDAAAASLLRAAGKDLAALQTELDGGTQVQGFDIPAAKLGAVLDIHQEKRRGRNVLARLTAPNLNPHAPALVIGAHIDHLGTGGGPTSRDTSARPEDIHHGADDNASGVAGVLEIAQWMAAEQQAGRLKLEREVIFAGWSGEEIGLLGANAWCRDLAKEVFKDENAKLNLLLGANLNMDMIGRFNKNLILQGLGSSDWWAGEIERRNAVTGLPLQTQQDCYLPTDASVFYVRGVPILNAFTGQHEDYHKPTDTADKINYPGIAKVTRFMGLVARSLATGADVPVYKEQKRPDEGGRGGMRVYLGTVPDYSQDGIEGVKLSGVSAIGPAAKAGVMAGDVIVRLAGKDIKNIYDYTFVMGVLKIGQETEIQVQRAGKTETLKITPGSRD
ncbi:MAG: ywaD 2 [Verrucomicrobiales bacterium]|nr:ywaD 2 [Verrucomicrobiales bacterium]